MNKGDIYKVNGLNYDLICVKSDRFFCTYSINSFVNKKLKKILFSDISDKYHIYDEQKNLLYELISEFEECPEKYNKLKMIFNDLGRDMPINRHINSYSVFKPHTNKPIDHTYLVLKYDVDINGTDHLDDDDWMNDADTIEVLDGTFHIFEKTKNIFNCYGCELISYLTKNEDKELTLCVESKRPNNGDIYIIEGAELLTPSEYYDDKYSLVASDVDYQPSHNFLVKPKGNNEFIMLKDYIEKEI